MKILTLVILFLSSSAHAKPFWAEKAAYEQEGKIFFVGVAVGCKDEADCREKSLSAVQREAQLYLGGYDPKGLPLFTQMIHTEDGTTYRLAWTHEEDLRMFLFLKFKEAGY